MRSVRVADVDLRGVLAEAVARRAIRVELDRAVAGLLQEQHVQHLGVVAVRGERRLAGSNFWSRVRLYSGHRRTASANLSVAASRRAVMTLGLNSG